MKVGLGVTNLECVCLLPNTISLVLLGFNNRRLLEHHWPTLCKLSLKSAKAFRVSFIFKDTTSFVSSTWLWTLHFFGAEGRSLVYMLNKSGRRVCLIPRGRPQLMGKGSENVEWIRTTCCLSLMKVATKPMDNCIRVPRHIKSDKGLFWKSTPSILQFQD